MAGKSRPHVARGYAEKVCCNLQQPREKIQAGAIASESKEGITVDTAFRAKPASFAFTAAEPAGRPARKAVDEFVNRRVKCVNLDPNTHEGTVFQYQPKKKVYIIKYYRTNPPRATAVKVLKDVTRATLISMLLPAPDQAVGNADLVAPAEETNNDTDSESETENIQASDADEVVGQALTAQFSTIDLEEMDRDDISDSSNSDSN